MFFCKLRGSAQDNGENGNSITPVAIGGSLGVLFVVVVAVVVIVCRKYVSFVHCFYLRELSFSRFVYLKFSIKNFLLIIDFSKVKLRKTLLFKVWLMWFWHFVLSLKVFHKFLIVISYHYKPSNFVIRLYTSQYSFLLKLETYFVWEHQRLVYMSFIRPMIE